MITLRPDQERVLADLRDSLTRHRRVLLQVPTGGGKTTIAAEGARRFRAKAALRMVAWGDPPPGRVWFLAHRRELVSQATARLAALGARPEVLAADAMGTMGGIAPGGSEAAGGGDTVVASIPTLLSRYRDGLPGGERPPLVWLDEAHHVAADGWQDILGLFPESRIIGMSATPYRSDGSGMGLGFEDVVVGPSPRELVAIGVLVEPELYAARQVGNEIAGDPVQGYLEHGRGAPAVCFTATVEYARELAGRFAAAGVPAATLDADMADEERDSVLRRWREGELRVVANVGILTEGFDFPELAVVILARNIGSESLFVQCVGRGLRGPKSFAAVLDHGGNLMRFGHPLAHRPADMDGRVMTKKPVEEDPDALRLCERCVAPFARSLKVCPRCGVEQRTPLPEERKAERLRRIEDMAGVGLSERRRIWDKISRTAVPGRSGQWQACYRYKAHFGLMPYEDAGVLGVNDGFRLKAVLFPRKRKAGK